MALPFYGRPRGVMEQMLEELGKLKEAHDLLDDIYLEIGPYKDRQVTNVTWNKVLNYFEFDDSE